MSQQGTGQRETHQTKNLKHVNEKTHQGLHLELSYQASRILTCLEWKSSL